MVEQPVRLQLGTGSFERAANLVLMWGSAVPRVLRFSTKHDRMRAASALARPGGGEHP